MRKIFVLPERVNFAFSLVEMLMALLVASLLMAALAPVMTRKIQENINISGSASSGRAPAMFKCWDYNSPELKYAQDGSNYKVLMKDFAIDDAWVVNFLIASGGGGGAGATQSVIAADSYAEPTDNISGGIKITYDMDDFEIDLMTGGGGGGGGGAAVYKAATCSGAPSVEKCECMGAVYDSRNKMCVINKKTQTTLPNAYKLCNSTVPVGKWQLPSGSEWRPMDSSLATALGIGGTYYGIWTRQWYTWGYNCQVWWYDCAKGDGNYSYWVDGMTNSTTYKCLGGEGGNPASCSPPTSCVKRANPQRGLEQGVATVSACTGGLAFGTYRREDGTVGAVQPCAAGCKYDDYGPSTTNVNEVTRYLWGNILNASSWGSSPYKSSYVEYTLCVYSDSGSVAGEEFYSISGGGGGASPAIKAGELDLNIKEKLKQRIKENVGGYIVLNAGVGGGGGNAASGSGQRAGDGYKGADSCIVVQNSSKKDMYKVCVTGGNGGGGANASVSDVLTNGYGRGATAVPASSSCYSIDYTSNSAGVRVDFNCAAEGKAGGNGVAGTDNPAKGGLGGASILTPAVRAANSGKNGVTPDGTLNPGAGGGGGTALKSVSGSSTTVGYGTGGSGARGYIRIKYNHKYEAAGGGGGGAGYVAHIKNINVGKSTTCAIKVGYGGEGGAAGAAGGNGGESSVTCANTPGITYKMYGGKGGKVGVSASGASGAAVGGEGGAAGDYDTTGGVLARLLSQGDFKGYKGEDGKQGGSGEASNYKQGVRSAGGGGGASGTGINGKCGGIYNKSGVCSSTVADSNNDISEPVQEALNGEGFNNGEIRTPKKDELLLDPPKFGSAGAGGGGGAWYIGKDPARGGAGLGGYVCIYWDKIE